MNIDDRQQLFLDIMEELFSDYPLNESVETDLDVSMAIYDTMEQFFVENYRYLTVEQQVYAVVKNVDVNEDLVDIMTMSLLDETIGSAIATVVHAIGQHRAAKKAQSAEADFQKKSSLAKQKGAVFAQRQNTAQRVARTSKNPSVVNAFKKSYTRARADKALGKLKTAQQQKSDADIKSQTAQHQLDKKKQQRQDLATKIDISIRKTKEAVRSGVHKIAGGVGRFLGKLT